MAHVLQRECDCAAEDAKGVLDRSRAMAGRAAVLEGVFRDNDSGRRLGMQQLEWIGSQIGMHDLAVRVCLLLLLAHSVCYKSRDLVNAALGNRNGCNGAGCEQVSTPPAICSPDYLCLASCTPESDPTSSDPTILMSTNHIVQESITYCKRKLIFAKQSWQMQPIGRVHANSTIIHHQRLPLLLQHSPRWLLHRLHRPQLTPTRLQPQHQQRQHAQPPACAFDERQCPCDLREP